MTLRIQKTNNKLRNLKIIFNIPPGNNVCMLNIFSPFRMSLGNIICLKKHIVKISTLHGPNSRKPID